MGSRADGFLSQDVQNRMKEFGWCPSAIEAPESRFNYIQTLHMLSKMDRSNPTRDHSKCTIHACAHYQIDARSYSLAHSVDGCKCTKSMIDISKVIEVLNKGDSVPLLKIIPGDDLEQLCIEIVESSRKPHTLQYLMFGPIAWETHPQTLCIVVNWLILSICFSV